MILVKSPRMSGAFILFLVPNTYFQPLKIAATKDSTSNQMHFGKPMASDNNGQSMVKHTLTQPPLSRLSS